MNNTTLGIVCTIAGVILGILGYKRTVIKDIQQEGNTQTSFKMQLEYISKGIDDIKSEMRDIKNDAKSQDKIINEVIKQLTRLEESLKSAHKRIDELEKGGL